MGFILFLSLALGFVGWDGALHVGNLVAALVATLLTLGLVWAAPRLPFLNPIRAHWIRPSGATAWLDGPRFAAQFAQAAWSLWRERGPAYVR